MNIQKEQIKKAWLTYIANHQPIPDSIEGVRDEILESWKRCQSNLDPFHTTSVFLPETLLQEKIQENAMLIQIAYPYLLEFYKHFQSDHYQIILTDSQGIQLKRIASTTQQDKLAQENDLYNGCYYSEEKAGTNGVGLCLMLEKPVMVLGYEHYLEKYHNVACYSAPIYDPSNQIIGCILITGPLSSFNPMIMGMLSAAISGIEREFKLTLSNQLLHSTMESLPSAILLLDSNKKIVHYNSKLLELLQIDENIYGKYIFDVIQLKLLPDDLRFLDRPITDIECTIVNKNHVHIDVSMTIKLQTLNNTLISFRNQKELHQLANQLAGTRAIYTFDDILGTSSMIQNLKNMGKMIAKSNQPTLIFGEMGTGKDIVAQSIHNASDRKKGPFVSVNCSVIQKSYLEIELWGSKQKDDYLHNNPGKIELAQDGTLFLIEISNLPMDVQEKLYLFLKTNEYIHPVTQYCKKMNVKVIASTSKNLFSLVENGMFRQDLYYLLNGYQLIVPPLKQRSEDILPLTNHYIQEYSKLIGINQPRLNDECKAALLHYSWPGNVRQLENVIDAAINSVSGHEIGLNLLPVDIVNEYYADKNETYFYASNRLEDSDSSLHPKAQEYNQILYAIKQANGNVKEASILLHMSLSTLYRKLNKYHIYPKEFEKRLK